MDMDRQLVEALSRGLRILDCFRLESPRLGNAEVARMTGLACSTVSRLTYTLVKEGYLEYDAGERTYRLGLRLLSLQPAVLAQTGLTDTIVPHLTELAEQTGETVLLSVYEHYALVAVKAAVPIDRHAARPVGYTYPVSGTAMGRAYVATCSAREMDDIVMHLNEGSEQLETALRTEFDEAATSYRQRGYCTALGIASPNKHSVAVPLHLQRLGRRMTMSVGGPAHRVTRQMLHGQIGPLLVRAAVAIERAFSREAQA